MTTTGRQCLSGQGYEITLGRCCAMDGYGPVEDWWVDEETYEKNKDLTRQENAKSYGDRG